MVTEKNSGYCQKYSVNDRKKKLGSSNFARGTNNFPECGDLYSKPIVAYYPDSDIGHVSHLYDHFLGL